MQSSSRGQIDGDAGLHHAERDGYGSDGYGSDGYVLRLANGLIRRRSILLAAAVILTLAGLIPANRLRFDQRIESFYAPDNPHLLNYLDSKKVFGGDEFVVVAFSDPQLFTEGGQLDARSAEQIRDFAGQLSKVPGVAAQSTQNIADALSVDQFPLLQQQRQKLRELVRGVLLGDDQKTTAIILRLVEEQQRPASRRQTIAEIRRVAAGFTNKTYVVGESVLVHDTFQYVEQDGFVLGWISTGLLMAVIALIFRRLRWILLPVLVVEITVIWTKALLVLSNLQLSMVSSVLNSLLMVVGTATVIHVIVRFKEHRLRVDPIVAVRRTLVDLTHAIFWTTATTAGGFAAQLTSHVTPVQSFGLMMGVGTMLVLVSSASVLPGGILLGPQELISSNNGQGGGIARLLIRLSDSVERHPWQVGLFCAALCIFSLTGMLWLRVETDFSKNFRPTTPVVEALNFVETRLGGSSVWEVNFSAPAELNDEFLDRVRKLAERLRELQNPERQQLTKVIAFTDGLDLVPLLPLPAKRLLLRQMQPEFESSLYRSDRQRMRIILRTHERQRSEERMRVIRDVNRIAQQEFPDAKASGLFVLLSFLIESLLGDQWVSFAIGAVMIIAMMAVAFRSLKIGLISLVPNLLPIVIVVGTMGWLELPINLGTAMISSVSMGLTVDSSIHYFTGYRRGRREGLDMLAALRETSQGVGTALMYTNLALIAGFLVLTMSHFMPLVYFGLLVSAAMLGGLIGNLVLLPLLIRAFRIE